MRQLQALFAFLGLMLAAAGAGAQTAPARSGPAAAPLTTPHTLYEALGLAYSTNPQLTGERAHLRSTDENVPTALSGWRPTIAVAGSYGWGVGRYDENVPCQQFLQSGNPLPPNCPSATSPSFQNSEGTQSVKNNRTVSSVQATVTQYIYRGGRTTASTHQAVNSVYAERARLIAMEEQVFTDAVNAYVGYVSAENTLAIDRENEQVLVKQLQATNDRFRVGELTRTDVAQAEAALAQAIATRQTAEGSLQTARATFMRTIGVEPPNELADPQPVRLPVKTEAEAAALAGRNNPNVIAALFNQAEQKDAVDVAFSALAPQLSLQGATFEQNGSSLVHTSTYGAQATVNLTLPIYQGGAEYAAVRQARQNYEQAVRQTEDARRAAVEQAVQAWDTLVAAKAAIDSSRVAIKSSEIALEGVEREALVGTRTTQDVLIAQQNLLTAQLTLVQNVTNYVEASYGIVAATGQLTARDLGLPVPLYDETAYYNEVKGALWGTGDRAVNQPGR